VKGGAYGDSEGRSRFFVLYDKETLMVMLSVRRANSCLWEWSWSGTTTGSWSLSRAGSRVTFRVWSRAASK